MKFKHIHKQMPVNKLCKCLWEAVEEIYCNNNKRGNKKKSIIWGQFSFFLCRTSKMSPLYAFLKSKFVIPLTQPPPPPPPAPPPPQSLLLRPPNMHTHHFTTTTITFSLSITNQMQTENKTKQQQKMSFVQRTKEIFIDQWDRIEIIALGMTNSKPNPEGRIQKKRTKIIKIAYIKQICNFPPLFLSIFSLSLSLFIYLLTYIHSFLSNRCFSISRSFTILLFSFVHFFFLLLS